MATDLAAHIAAEEAHTRALAADPGWREYIEHKAQRMARWQPAMYGHLPALVAQIPPPTQPARRLPNAI